MQLKMSNTPSLCQKISLTRLLLAVLVSISTASLLVVVHLKAPFQLILLERFYPNIWYLEVILVALYGGLIAFKVADPVQSAKWRKNIWLFFSFVFFSQLILGMAVDERFLMTGKLHFPIPAMILAGPIYRMQFSFMTILFISTVILCGSAWCSYLCYFGALDGLASRRRPRKKSFRKYRDLKHLIILGTLLLPILFSAYQLHFFFATSITFVFGIGGILTMITISRKRGKMFHCTVYCPIGTLVNYSKRFSPFRIKISSKCTQCMACKNACHYDALNSDNISQRKVGFTCTMCGDCISTCHNASIRYSFLNNSKEYIRYLFLFIVITLHALFLALARI